MELGHIGDRAPIDGEDTLDSVLLLYNEVRAILVQWQLGIILGLALWRHRFPSSQATLTTSMPQCPGSSTWGFNRKRMAEPTVLWDIVFLISLLKR